ncbi:hypothetical protein [Erwinia sp. MYb416]|uniref:hypothetical protein n=1 Tax=Erwinia sp. MYb416 TaxID=3108532 RepID=UPI0030B407E5
MGNYCYEKLKGHILSLSESDDFEVAKREWVLNSIEISEKEAYCPCGQKIKEHCFITNKLNNNATCVGSICMHKFLEIPTRTLFLGLRKIKKNTSSNANLSLIEYAKEKGFIYNNEYVFLVSTINKKNLSGRQLNWKVRINTRILNETIVLDRTIKDF